MLLSCARSLRLRSWLPCALRIPLIAAGFPVPCRAADSAPSVGYLRSRYREFAVLLLPAKPGAQPAGAPKSVSAKAVDGRAEVPAGEYYISNWMVAGDDAEG